MIARIWHGVVPTGKSEEYLTKMRSIALPDYKATPGNRGAFCLVRRDGDVTHFDMLSFWDDIGSINRFAGEDIQVAKYYEFDPAFLLELERTVLHYDVYAD
jgi:hypothetical protein